MNQKTKKTDLYLINPKNISVQENFNSRRDFGDIEELAEQIATQGVLNPIHVRPIEGENNKYLLVDGERRYRAVMHNINNGIDIEYMYAFIGKADGKAMTVIRVDDEIKAISALNAGGIALLTTEDISAR